MCATECSAHTGYEVLPDAVAWQPRPGAGAPGGTLVRRVRFRADDDDVLEIERAECVAAAPGEVSGVNEDKIRPFCEDRRGQIGPVSDGAELPAGLVAFQQLDDQAS